MPVATDPAQTAAWVTDVIRQYAQTRANRLFQGADEPAFDTPRVGFARGDDPIFESYKEHVGPFHWTPLEAFRLHYPEIEATAADLAVIVYVLPQTPKTKEENAAMDRFPSERWARARVFGDEFNVNMRRTLVEALIEAGVPALAPQLSEHWGYQASEPYGLASNWSERHAAHAAGLGTFGLCDALITPWGKAHRLGSVTAKIDLPPTPRPYTGHQEYCLWFTHGTCLKCVDRCPVGALTAEGHDKNRCLAHLIPSAQEYIRENYRFEGYSCGLCQTGVPCADKIPLPEEG